MKPILVVLAAGMGSRYGGLKQIDPIGPSGESMLDYSIFDAIRAGFRKVVFIIRKDIEDEFKKSVGSKFEKQVQVEYAYQELAVGLPKGFILPQDRSKPWGTGHAILMVKDIVDGPFAVINSDDFYGKSSFDSLFNYLSNQQFKEDRRAAISSYCMVGFALKNTLSEFGSVSRGICSCDSNDNLKAVAERTDIRREKDKIFYFDEGDHLLTGNEIVSLNMWGFTSDIFLHLETMFEKFIASAGRDLKSEFYAPFAVDQLIKSGMASVKVLKSFDSWFGITYKEDRDYVVKSISKLIMEERYPQKLY